MKYVSVDIETTGLNPEVHDILQIAMVIEDTNDIIPLEKLPYINLFVDHENFRVDTETLRLFPQNFEKWEKAIRFDHWDIVDQIEKFLLAYFNKGDKVTMAGKNVGTFDLQFLKKLSFFNEMDVTFGHRVIDPAIMFVDFMNDERLPNLSTCLERIGADSIVTHDAYEDALQVIQLIRAKSHINNINLPDECGNQQCVDDKCYWHYGYGKYRS